MLYMNRYDIDLAAIQHRHDPVLSRATRFLQEHMQQVNEHSDGWAYWKAPVMASRKLIELIKSGSATEQQLNKALVPLKSFYTRRGYAAGMQYPEAI